LTFCNSCFTIRALKNSGKEILWLGKFQPLTTFTP
jgi:hypothetical protein